MSKDALLSSLYLEFVNIVNEVGVDINEALAHPYTAGLLQFVCGLGPRKAAYILKVSWAKQVYFCFYSITPVIRNFVVSDFL